MNIARNKLIRMLNNKSITYIKHYFEEKYSSIKIVYFYENIKTRDKIVDKPIIVH